MTSLDNPDDVLSDWLDHEGGGSIGASLVRVTKTLLCKLLNIPRTSIYRKHASKDTEREERIMARIDYHHTEQPYLGVRRLRIKLREDDDASCQAAAEKGESYEPMKAGRKLIKRLMEEMGIRATYPKPNLSEPGKYHKKFPYLLRDKSFIRFPNQVWSIDITYIKLAHGHMYLTAIIDWCTRYIVGWTLSDTLEAAPVVEAVRAAIAEYGTPAIINSDQGSQFTSAEYMELLADMSIRQSMDGKGRWADNVIIERWFRSLKTEDIYLNEYNSPRELRAGVSEYIGKYNHKRPHESLDYKTPARMYSLPFAEAA
jgi:putative transposase